MDNRDGLCRDNTAKRRFSIIEKMICTDLHYCCLWAFFKLYKQTGLIAARLGVSSRAIRYLKARF